MKRFRIQLSTNDWLYIGGALVGLGIAAIGWAILFWLSHDYLHSFAQAPDSGLDSAVWITNPSGTETSPDPAPAPSGTGISTDPGPNPDGI